MSKLRDRIAALEAENRALKAQVGAAEILAECEASAPKEIVIGPTHPAWTAIDDDDWNGATFANWLEGLVGYLVVIAPSDAHSLALIERVRAACARYTREVRVAMRQL